MTSGSSFKLSTKIEHYLATLSKLYERKAEREKREIIVNSQVRVHEGWTQDRWDNYGHALYLAVPEGLYLNLVNERDFYQDAIKDDLNKLHDVQDEFIAAVFFEMEETEDEDWRRDSGLLLRPHQRVYAVSTEERIWGSKRFFRLFLSHKTDVKKNAFGLKEQLEPFGVSAFVAHADVEPTKEWQDEIESALASMDAFVALLTGNFHESDWTDQEVGYALGRGVPLIVVKMGRDPYGFIGKFQALACNWEDVPTALVELLIKQQPRMLEAYINAMPKCRTFEEGNHLAEVLPSLKTLTEEQAHRLQSAFNGNKQLQRSYGFAGSWPSKYGLGLAAHLTRITGKEYVTTASGEIQLKK